MEFPQCPVCKEGRMLPFSFGGDPFHLWVCNTPSCTYVVSFSHLPATYYKGMAATTDKEKDGKAYKEFSF